MKVTPNQPNVSPPQRASTAAAPAPSRPQSPAAAANPTGDGVPPTGTFFDRYVSLKDGVLKFDGSRLPSSTIDVRRTGDVVTLKIQSVEYRLNGAAVKSMDITGGRGSDKISVNGVDGTIRGGRGNDRIQADYGSFQIDGGRDNDTITAGLLTSNNRIDGGSGNDNISLFSMRPSTNNTVLGGDGDDTLFAASSRDVTMDGGAGNDTMRVEMLGTGTALMRGGAGQDRMTLWGLQRPPAESFGHTIDAYDNEQDIVQIQGAIDPERDVFFRHDHLDQLIP